MFSRHKEASTFFLLTHIKKIKIQFYFSRILHSKKVSFFFSIKSSSNCQVLEKRNEKEFDFIAERHLEFRWKNKPLDIAEIFVSKVIARQWSGGTTKMYPKHLCGWLTTADQNVHSIRHCGCDLWVCVVSKIFKWCDNLFHAHLFCGDFHKGFKQPSIFN